MGEDFLHNFLGMIGIPIDLYPTFPSGSDVMLLTEGAAFDPNLMGEMKEQLEAGKTVVITSGLLHALEGKGVEDLVEIRFTDNEAGHELHRSVWPRCRHRHRQDRESDPFSATALFDE